MGYSSSIFMSLISIFVFIISKSLCICCFHVVHFRLHVNHVEFHVCYTVSIFLFAVLLLGFRLCFRSLCILLKAATLKTLWQNWTFFFYENRVHDFHQNMGIYNHIRINYGCLIQTMLAGGNCLTLDWMVEGMNSWFHNRKKDMHACHYEACIVA